MIGGRCIAHDAFATMFPRVGGEAAGIGRFWKGIWAGASRLSLRLVSFTSSTFSLVIVTFLRLVLVSVVSRSRWFCFTFQLGVRSSCVRRCCGCASYSGSIEATDLLN